MKQSIMSAAGLASLWDVATAPVQKHVKGLAYSDHVRHL